MVNRRKEYFQKYHEQVRRANLQKPLQKGPEDQDNEVRSHLLTLRVREADLHFMEQLAAERRYEGEATSSVMRERMGEAMKLEDFVVETLESVLASERLRRSIDPENYKSITCPKCGQIQYINKAAHVDGWRCNKCMHDLFIVFGEI